MWSLDPIPRWREDLQIINPVKFTTIIRQEIVLNCDCCCANNEIMASNEATASHQLTREPRVNASDFEIKRNDGDEGQNCLDESLPFGVVCGV